MGNNAPIVVFAYNRRDKLEEMFATLSTCERFAETPVTVYIDGPKNAEDLPSVNKVRDYVCSLPFENVTSVIKKENDGLKDSIFKGVTEMCKKYDRVIVIEDDLLLSPVALEYFNIALNKYADDPHVWSVVGYQYDAPELRSCNRALVLPFTYPWGWATWSRAWLQYNMYDPIDPMDLKSKSFRCGFDVYGTRQFRDMLVAALAGRLSCWFTPWYYKIFCERGVSIFPPRSYVAHNGYTGGTHASKLNPYTKLVTPALPSDILCEMPEELKVDYWAIDLIRSCWDARVQNLIGLLGGIKRRLFFWKYGTKT